MNLDAWNDADRLALQAFYEAGQQWSWQEVSDGSSAHGRNVRSWIESSPPPRNRPIILPALRQGHQEPIWFAIAFSEAQAEELREQLIAFVGPTGSDYRGARADRTRMTRLIAQRGIGLADLGFSASLHSRNSARRFVRHWSACGGCGA